MKKKKYNFYHNLTLIVSGESKQTILRLFGNVVLITLFVIFRNMCE